MAHLYYLFAWSTITQNRSSKIPHPLHNWHLTNTNSLGVLEWETGHNWKQQQTNRCCISLRADVGWSVDVDQCNGCRVDQCGQMWTNGSWTNVWPVLNQWMPCGQMQWYVISNQPASDWLVWYNNELVASFQEVDLIVISQGLCSMYVCWTNSK